MKIGGCFCNHRKFEYCKSMLHFDLKSFLRFDIVVLARQCIPVFQPVGSLASVRFHTYFVEPVDIVALGSMCKK